MCCFRTSSRDRGRQSSLLPALPPRCCNCSGKSAMSMKSPIAVMHALEIGLLGPVQFGLLDEEIFVVIPTGDFNRLGSLWPGDFYIHIPSPPNHLLRGH